MTLKLPGVSILRSGKDGPYAGLVSISKATGEHQDSIEFTTQTYNHLDFEGILDLDGTVTDQGIDTNGNGLYDVLRVSFDADIRSAGTFVFSAELQSSRDGQFLGFFKTLMALDAGQQTLTVDFSGPEINTRGVDGPYDILLRIYDADTGEKLDQVALGQPTGPYSYRDFDPKGGVKHLYLTGYSIDGGIDTNSNGLFDQLVVNTEVAVTIAGSYTWSARLVDANGIDLGFYSVT